MTPWTDCVEVYLSDGLEAYVTPAGPERVGVAFLWEDGRVPPQISWPALVQRVPALAARLRDAAADSTPRGAGPLRRRVRERIRPRFALLGDAAGYVDAITGEGLSLALVCAEALGACLPDAVARGGDPAAFRPYLAVCRREYRRYALVAGSVLSLARHPRLRRAVLATLALSPEAFSWLLAHTIA
jgi:flavin-dependent dehydrogenase